MPQAERTISLSFTMTWLRMAEQNGPGSHQLSWSSPSDRAMKGTSPPAQWAHSGFREGSAPRAEDLACLKPSQNLLCVSMMLISKESSGTLQENKEQAVSFFSADDLILHDKTAQRTYFLLYWKNYKQKGINKELEEKEKAFSACKCFIRSVNPAGHVKHLPLELESWVECIWTVCEGTHWKQIPLLCLQQPYSVIAQIQRRSNFTSNPSICEF